MALRIWYGMGVTAWWRLLARHRFAVGPDRVPAALAATAISLRNSMAGGVQSAILRARRPRPIEPPVFILGHWRCGTTWLHELLAQDPRHTFPRTYDCIFPHHFLWTEGLHAGWLQRRLAPGPRPMDAVRVDWLSPQEDEFALLNLGLPSAYARLAFPNRPWRPVGEELALDLSPTDLDRWKRAFRRFVDAVATRHPGRLVLKSPLHMGRIRTLLELFPDARFVHIVRDPSVVFPSTLHMWRSMYRWQGLQRPDGRGLEAFVLDAFEELHSRLDAARGLIAPGRYCDVRYEALARDPVRVIEDVYARLGLGSIEPVRHALRRHVNATAGYPTNRYRLAAGAATQLARRWGTIAGRQGYPMRAPHEEAHALRAGG